MTTGPSLASRRVDETVVSPRRIWQNAATVGACSPKLLKTFKFKNENYNFENTIVPLFIESSKQDRLRLNDWKAYVKQVYRLDVF